MNGELVRRTESFLSPVSMNFVLFARLRLQNLSKNVLSRKLAHEAYICT
jgi:hypothetical protein